MVSSEFHGFVQSNRFEQILMKRLIDIIYAVLLDEYLQVDHLLRRRCLGVFAGIEHRNLVLLDLLLDVPQLPLHLVASSDFVDELSLESVDVGVQLKREYVKPLFTFQSLRSCLAHIVNIGRTLTCM